MKKLLFVIAIAACGGGKGVNRDPMKPIEPPKTECHTVAAHMAEAVLSFKDPPPIDKATVAEVIEKHCEADKWTADAKQCFGSMTEANAETCAKTLTEEQHDKVMGDMMSRMNKPMNQPAQSAPPAPGAPSGGGPNKSNDPCEGGE